MRSQGSLQSLPASLLAGLSHVSIDVACLMHPVSSSLAILVVIWKMAASSRLLSEINCSRQTAPSLRERSWRCSVSVIRPLRSPFLCHVWVLGAGLLWLAVTRDSQSLCTRYIRLVNLSRYVPNVQASSLSKASSAAH
jgi:hypothetical protein